MQFFSIFQPIGIITLIVGLISATTNPASGQEKKAASAEIRNLRVAVAPLSTKADQNLEKSVASVAQIALQDAIQQINGLLIIDPFILAGQFDSKAITSKGQVARMQKKLNRLGGDVILLGQVEWNAAAKTMQLTCRFVTSEAKNISPVTVSAALQSDADRFDLLLDFCKKIISALGKNISAESPGNQLVRMRKHIQPTQNFRAYEFYADGRRSLLKGGLDNYKSARLNFEKAQRIDGAFELARAGMLETIMGIGAYTQQQGGQAQTLYSEAWILFQQSEEKSPSTLSESYRAISQILSTGKYSNAEHSFKAAQKAASICPNDYEAVFLMWQAVGSKPEHQLAKRLFRLNPHYLPALNTLAVNYNFAGKVDQAIETYKKILEFDPENIAVICNLGSAYAQSNQTKNLAIDMYRKALSIQPEYAPAHNAIGLVHFSRKDIDAAIESFKRAAEIDKKSFEAHNNLGAAYFSKNMWKESARHSRKALRINPNSADANYRCGLAYEKFGDADEAKRFYEKAAKLGMKQAKEKLK